MSDIFISYARSTADQAQSVVMGLRALGYDVWRDDELPPHRSYAEVIDERLQAAKAVVVIWSAEAVKSEWVQSEADTARTARKLVQLTLDGSSLPRPFDRIQCADMVGWTGDPDAPGWRKVVASVSELVGGARSPEGAAAAAPYKLSVCVLPFANMSDDPQQEYFSDGISEDIITDLSKVSVLSVIARNTAFTYKGRAVKVPDVARELGVSHVLEGSVRKSGNRVRITAQLIDGTTGEYTWAERYDRNLDDIFALQDEISQAIVKALKLKLMPQEKKAIEQRGTDNVEAYDLYLMARSYLFTGNTGDPHPLDAVERLTRRVVEIDPGYALAWALMANGQSKLRQRHGRTNDGGEAALERALALDPDLGEAHALKAWILFQEGRHDEAAAQIAVALRLDPESFEVNRQAGQIHYRQGHAAAAIPYYEKAATLTETDLSVHHILMSCYIALGDQDSARRFARIALETAEKVVSQDRSNGFAMSCGVFALAALGEADWARDWMRRALLIDPDNLVMRYSFACALASSLSDPEAALAMLGPTLERDTGGEIVSAAATDPDFVSLRDDPRFQAILAAAEARLAAAGSAKRAGA